jgi:hypothetical protein
VTEGLKAGFSWPTLRTMAPFVACPAYIMKRQSVHSSAVGRMQAGEELSTNAYVATGVALTFGHRDLIAEFLVLHSRISLCRDCTVRLGRLH